MDLTAAESHLVFENKWLDYHQNDGKQKDTQFKKNGVFLGFRCDEYNDIRNGGVEMGGTVHCHP